MPKLNSPGCTTRPCCIVRPCCSAVWDFVREDAAGARVTLSAGGTFIDTTAFIEYSLAPSGARLYQCGSRPFPRRVVLGSFSAPNYPLGSGIDPGSGSTFFELAWAWSEFFVLSCFPSPSLRVSHAMAYGYQQGTNPTADVTGAGYDYNPTSGSYSQGSIGPNFIEVHSVRNRTPGFENQPFSAFQTNWAMEISVSYMYTFTNMAQVLSALPATQTLTPIYNPLGYSMAFALL